MGKVARFRDSYYHYRKYVGLGRLHACYRSLYYEFKGREPYLKEK